MDDDFDPHLERINELKHPISNLETIFHLFKGCLGTGVLALPEAFKHSGMINGIISSAIIALFATYCLHVLVRGQYILCKKRKVGLLKYAESMQVACEVGPDSFKSLGNIASALVDFTLCFYQTGACCAYIVFCGTSVKYVADVYTKSEQKLYIYMLCLFVPFTLLLLIRNLKKLAPFSLVADIVTFIVFGAVFYYIGKNLDSKFGDRPAFGKVLDYPLLFGNVMFSLQSVPVVLATENEMATPKFFRAPLGALNITFAFLTVLYILVAVLGYWCYGEDINSTITMNFPIKQIFAQVVTLAYVFCIYVSYGLNAYVPITIFLDSYINKSLDKNGASERKKIIVEYVLRLCFVIFTFLFAILIPYLGLVISLIGSVFLSCLGIIFPAFIEIAAYWEEGTTKTGTVWFWKNIVMVILGIFGLLAGSSSAIRAIVEEFRKK